MTHKLKSTENSLNMQKSLFTNNNYLLTRGFTVCTKKRVLFSSLFGRQFFVLLGTKGFLAASNLQQFVPFELSGGVDVYGDE